MVDSTETPVTGSGRIMRWHQPGRLATVVWVVKSMLRKTHVQVATRDGFDSSSEDQMRSADISRIAICVGSGGSVLKGVEADVYLTGEMSHHEILAANAAGVHVVLCNHSATERPWLRRLQRQLGTKLAEIDPHYKYEVLISKADKEPLETH